MGAERLLSTTSLGGSDMTSAGRSTKIKTIQPNAETLSAFSAAKVSNYHTA